MNREDISKGVGNIDDKYIIEAEEYSQATNCKTYIKTTKKLQKVACVLLIICSVLGLFITNIHKKTTNETVYKPTIMYKNELYFLTGNHPITYDIDKHELIFIGIIQDTITPKALPSKNFQVNCDFANSTIYLSEQYRNHIFMYDSNNKLWVFEFEETDE